MEGIRPGEVIDDRYEVLTELGEGGMGVVFQARQASMNRDVAIKFLKSALLAEKEQVDRFMREAQLASRLKHENIVNIYSVGTTHMGHPYIAMEFLEGQRLSDLIAARGFLPAAEALPLFIQVCDALSHAHEMAIVHRDIKPSNIMLTHLETGEIVVKVVDFGIAKSITGSMPALTQTGLLMGSAFYMSPGQCAGRASDVRSDVYSLGCTLFEALTGKPPFIGDSFYETLSKQLSEAPPVVNEVNKEARISNELQAVVDCMLEKEPTNRYQSMALLKSDLKRILAGEKPVGMPVLQPSSSPYLIKKPGKKKTAIFVALLGGLAICAYLGWPLIDSITRPSQTPDLAESVHQLYGKAVIAELGGRYEEASKFLDEALQGARQMGEKHRVAAYTHRQGWLEFKKWSKTPERSASDLRLSNAKARIAEAAISLEREVLPHLANIAGRGTDARDDATMLLICYWDLFRIYKETGDEKKQLELTDKFARVLRHCLSFADLEKQTRSMTDFAVTYSIRSGDEKSAMRYIRLVVDVLPALQLEPADVQELSDKYTELVTARFSPKVGTWCTAQFASKERRPQ